MVELQRQIAELQWQVAALTASHAALLAEIAQLKRGGKGTPVVQPILAR